jgi:hypothetical protein
MFTCYPRLASSLSWKGVAEGVGFEPTVLSYNGFQDRRLKPLGHPSLLGTPDGRKNPSPAGRAGRFVTADRNPRVLHGFVGVNIARILDFQSRSFRDAPSGIHGQTHPEKIVTTHHVRQILCKNLHHISGEKTVLLDRSGWMSFLY